MASRVYIIMGVSGCGKTTVGQSLSQRLRVPFLDADDFHPAANIDKMRQGIPLNDQDREPWLRTLAAKISDAVGSDGAVLACSALKEKYRAILRDKHGSMVRFVYLKGSKELILGRISSRQGHFMPSTLLDSQFATLEEPADAITVPVELTPQEICDRIIAANSSVCL